MGKNIVIKNDFSRITIDMPKVDHKKLKAISAILGKSMRELVIESIREHLYKYPNKETLKAIENVENGKNLTKTKDINDLFEKLDI